MVKGRTIKCIGYLFVGAGGCALAAAGCTDVLVGGLGETPSSISSSDPSETETDSGSDTVAPGDTGSDSARAPDIELCDAPDTYDELGEVCYVDGANGDDENSGLSPETPLRTQAAVQSRCTVLRFKRGSVFNETLALRNRTKVYTNYGDASDPLPRFVVPDTPMSGPVIQAAGYAGITIDGIYVAGARSDGTPENIIGGICAFLGADSKLLNSEIADCEVGVAMTGQGSLLKGNLIRDLVVGIPADPESDPNLAGGAAGVFIYASNNEIAYNSFINCTGAPAAGSRSCDGGATEVTVAACETVTGIDIHHNFSLNSCGFLGMATYFGECKGSLTDVTVHHNLAVDSAWMGFLQVNNTDFDNIRYYNNTIVQREGSQSAGTLWVVFTGLSSGRIGGELLPETVYLANNLYVLDGVTPFGSPIDDRFEQSHELLIYADEVDPGLANIDGTEPGDFDLTAKSPAVDQGAAVGEGALDFMHRAVPDTPGGGWDVGAFEFGSTQAECLPPRSPR